jgi:hypothetical protein
MHQYYENNKNPSYKLLNIVKSLFLPLKINFKLQRSFYLQFSRILHKFELLLHIFEKIESVNIYEKLEQKIQI